MLGNFLNTFYTHYIITYFLAFVQSFLHIGMLLSPFLECPRESLQMSQNPSGHN